MMTEFLLLQTHAHTYTKSIASLSCWFTGQDPHVLLSEASVYGAIFTGL